MDHDWQSAIFSIRDRAALLLKNEILTDVRFTFPDSETTSVPITLQAHKLILANASIVFQKMFYGDLKENTEQAIEIAEMESKTFAIMLKYIYSDKIELETWVDAAKVYTAANRYMLIALAEFCIDFINGKLEAENAIKIFEFANFYDKVVLKQKALEKIRNQTLLVFQSQDFSKIHMDTLMTILEQNELQANEMDLYDALEALVSAKTKLQENRTAEKSSSLMQNFRQAIKKIDFTKMTAEQFSRGPALSKLFLKEEAFDILLCLNQPSNIKTRYPKDFVLNVRQKSLPHVFFEVTVDGTHIGHFLIELREDVVPKTIKKFLPLCNGERNIGFKGAEIYGDNEYIGVATKDSVYEMECENFILKHTSTGVVVLNGSYGSDLSDFYITTSVERTFDDEDVVIGRVVEGMDVVNYLNKLILESNETLKNIKIENCDQIDIEMAKAQ